MHVLIGIALKSLLIAGLTLGLLKLMRQRSAAERSWVAHIGLLALVIMALAPLVLPSWNVEAPALLGAAPTPWTGAQTLVTASPVPQLSASARQRSSRSLQAPRRSRSARSRQRRRSTPFRLRSCCSSPSSRSSA